MLYVLLLISNYRRFLINFSKYFHFPTVTPLSCAPWIRSLSWVSRDKNPSYFSPIDTEHDHVRTHVNPHRISIWFASMDLIPKRFLPLVWRCFRSMDSTFGFCYALAHDFRKLTDCTLNMANFLLLLQGYFSNLEWYKTVMVCYNHNCLFLVYSHNFSLILEVCYFLFSCYTLRYWFLLKLRFW